MPSGGSAKDTGSVLYVILDTGTGHVKIGRADDPRNRLKRLQTGNSHELLLLATVRGAGWREPDLHRRFSGAKMQGEWFTARASLDILKTVLAIGPEPHHYCYDCGGILGDVPGAGCRHDVPLANRQRSPDYPFVVCASYGCLLEALAVHWCCRSLVVDHYGAWYCRDHL